MNETPQQYTQRILSYVEDKEPLAIQAATAEKLNQLIKGAATSELRRRPAPEKWSANEIVAHLADAEIVIGYRLRLVLGSPGAVNTSGSPMTMKFASNMRKIIAPVR